MTPLEESSSEVRFNAWWNQWRKGFDPGVTDGDVMSDMNSSEGAWEAQEAYWHEQLAAEKLVSEGLRGENHELKVKYVVQDPWSSTDEIRDLKAQVEQMTRDIQRKDEALKEITLVNIGKDAPMAACNIQEIADVALKSLGD